MGNDGIIICPICKKRTRNGRVPRGGTGDYRFPSRHKAADGSPCEGNTEEGVWECDLTDPPALDTPPESGNEAGFEDLGE